MLRIFLVTDGSPHAVSTPNLKVGTCLFALLLMANMDFAAGFRRR